MSDIIEKSVTALIGDFYEGHADRDYYKMSSSLERIDKQLASGETAHVEFMEYFNELFSGRTAFNTLLNVKDYPVESVIRELFQNAFDCDYEEEDVKIAVNFKSDDTISISYNEAGFTLEQFMFYLSFGRNTGNELREGRFGVGAKSVFMNVEWLSMRSNNFSFCITNNQGLLKIADISLRRPVFKGTEMVIKVNAEQYAKIKDNFISLTEKKSEYISLMELCFAFNRKKVLSSKEPDKISDKRTFNIAVMEEGKLIDFYKVYNHTNKAVNVNVIRFTQGGKSAVDFICHEDDGFVYLIPFAVAMSKREGLVRLLTDKYNYFSTYELTGLIKDTQSSFANQKLSAFFISVPNRNITTFRTGVRPDKEQEVLSHVEKSVLKIIEDFGRFFVLELTENPDESGLYHLRPESYAFEFIKNFILSGHINSDIKKDFLRSISLRYAREETPLHYSEIQKNAFYSTVKDVSEERRLNGSANEELLVNKLIKMNQKLSDIKDRILYVGYEWKSETSGKSETAYVYEFHKNGNVMAMSSENNPVGTDYDMYDGFTSLTKRLLEQALGCYRILDEERLEKMFAELGDVYGEEYRVALKDNKFYIEPAGEQCPIEISGMKIGNIIKLMNCLEQHKKLFLTYQDYCDTVKKFLEIFANGREPIEFLLEIKKQGGEVVLKQGANREYFFMAYDAEFPINSKVTFTDLIEIVGDLNVLIKHGVLEGKRFDFDHGLSRYSFEPQKVADALVSENLPKEQIADLAGRVYVCNLKTDKIALLGEDDVLIEIIDHRNGIDAGGRALTKKYIVLRDDDTKEEFADKIEAIVTGQVRNLIRRRYMGAKAAKIVIPDQLPFYMKPMPNLNQEELNFLRGVVREIKDNSLGSRNFYAKDVNFKLFGYGAVCSLCRYETDALNGFSIKSFEANLMNGDVEQTFKFSLYLCANDAVVCDSWVIDDLRIGGDSPFVWLEEITRAASVSTKHLLCTLVYREQITYDMSKTEGDERKAIMSAQRKNTDIVLTPLMAANWVEENINILKNNNM
ncbi:MAG: hypothetical protein FWH08_00145 [Oscillospiraceae bacterium]|nr:hypothetical protein [Oscillospiraceae bacterium]